MSNQKRSSRNRQKFVYYLNIFFETIHAYQVSNFFVEQTNEIFNIFVFDTRLDRIVRALDTRSQIVQEKSQQSKASASLKFLLEHDIDDFDKEKNEKDMKSQQEDEIEDSHTFTRQIERQITSFATKSQRQSRHTHSHRRFIIEFQSTTQQAIIIVEKTVKLFLKLIDRNVEFLISLMMKDIDEFKKSVIERFANWMQSIFMLFEQITRARDLMMKIQQKITNLSIQTKKQARQNIAQVQKLSNQQTQLQHLKSQLLVSRNSVNDLVRQKIETIRMRRLKDEYKERSDELIEEVKSLKLNKEVLKKEILDFFNRRSEHSNLIDDSDQENTHRRQRSQRAESKLLTRNSLRRIQFFEKRVFDRFSNSASLEFFASNRSHHEQKIKYQNISYFYENHAEWRRWRSHLRTKIESDSWQFFIERNKIYYVKNHCKELAWNTIEHRTNYDSLNFYEFLEKLFNDFENVCENFDKTDNCYNELFDDKFYMKFKNKNETFEQYFDRFNIFVASLNLNDSLKINQLYRTISKHLNHNIDHLSKIKNFSRFVREMRAIVHKKKTLDDIERSQKSKFTKIIKFKITVSFSRTIKDKVVDISFTTRITKDRNTKYNLSRLSSHIVVKLKFEKRCYKCFKFEHRVNENDASCKEQEIDFKERVIVELTQLEVKWDETEIEEDQLLMKEIALSIDDEQKN